MEKERLLFALKTKQITVEDLKGAVVKEVTRQEGKENSVEFVVEVNGGEYLWGLRYNFDI